MYGITETTSTATATATAKGLEVKYTKGAKGDGVNVTFNGTEAGTTVKGLDQVGEIVQVGSQYEYKLVSNR